MKRVTKEIGDGDVAVRYTLREMMCRLATRDAQDPRLRRLAEWLSKGKNPMEATRAIFRHVVHTIRYASDPVGIEQVAAPIYTLKLAPPHMAFGDCDDMCTALAALLLAINIEVSFRVIAWRLDDYTHVSCIAHLPGGVRLPLDPVMGEAGFGNHKTDGIRRQEEYRCTMKGVTLEDRLSGCGCKKPRQKCCPQNAATSPVNVNVITSAGGQDFSRRFDLYSDRSSASAMMPVGVRRDIIIPSAPPQLPSPQPAARTLPAAPYVTGIAPQSVAPNPIQPHVDRPEFY